MSNIARDGRNESTRRDLADDIVSRIRDEEITRRVDREANGRVEHGVDRGAVVAEARRVITRDRQDNAGGRHFTDDIIASVGNEEVPGGIEREAAGMEERGGGCLTSIAGIAGAAVSCDGGDHTGRRDLANDVVIRVGDVDIPRRVNDLRGRIRESRQGGVLAVAAVAGTSQSRDGRDHAGGVDFANDIIRGIRNIKVAGRIQRKRHGTIQSRCRRGRAVATESRGTEDSRNGGYDTGGSGLANRVVVVIGDVEIPRGINRDRCWSVKSRALRDNSGDSPRRTHLANDVIVLVGDIEISSRINGDSERVVKQRGSRRAAVAAITTGAGATSRDGADHSRRGDLADRIVEVIRDIEIPRGIHGDTRWTAELRNDRLAAVTAIPSGPVPRDRGDDSRGRDFSDRGVAPVSDVEVSRAIQRQPLRIVELSERCETAVAAVPG